MLKLSVLVPCYNVEKYVEECLSSIQNQTFKDIEVIVINDGSKDSTLSIIEKFLKADKRFKLLNKTNSGYGDSMNKGLQMCTGEYVGIVESDDFIEPDMFDKLISNAEINNLDISRCTYFDFKNNNNSVISNDWVPKNTVYDPNENTAPFWQAPSIWAAIYRREMLEKNHIRFLPTPGASYQDTAFSFKCYACCKRFCMIDTPLLHYRTDNEQSSINSPGKVYCVCDEWDEIYRFVRSDKKRFGHLYSIMPLVQFGTYRWNYGRLNPTLRRQFLWHLVKEYSIRLLRGEVKIHQFPKGTFKRVLNKLLH